MAVIHISEAELARDVHGVLDQIRKGAEIVVEGDGGPVAVMKSPQQAGRTLSESIAIAKRWEQERGHTVTLDPDFGADVEEIVRNRETWNPPSWD